ncbi:MAG: hemerythrin domain-containing protein [Thalassobaculum sp.]|uniref:hemerythrin domain-containing protein n=1 Tax=Thalassobaculum sp. TaxID=2022740 RepID=UPI0032EB6840
MNTRIESSDIEDPDTPSLIAHIVQRYHEAHRRELPELVRLSSRVEAVHRDHPSVPGGLADALERLSGDLGSHMAKEEAALFPLMLDGGHPMIAHPIAQMRHEHDDHGAAIGEIREICRGFVLPADACRSWRTLYAGAEKLVVDLAEHVLLENGVLFPRFEAPVGL